MDLVSAARERFITWAIRAKTPEPSPIVLHRQRIYVLPTRTGLAFATTLVVMLIGAINYNLGLGYALTFLLGGLGVVDIFHAFANLAGLTITAGRAPPVFAGDTAVFHLLVRGSGIRRRLRFWLASEEVWTDLADAVSSDVAVRAPSQRRGWLPLPRVGIETLYPLGFIRAWAYCAPDLRCLIYPRPASKAPPLPVQGGETAGQRIGASGNDDFSGLRHHQPSDPPRHVAWKAAARSGPDLPLLTKQFSGAAAARLWLDWYALPAGTDVEDRLAILTRWAVDAHAQGLQWGLRLPARTLAPASGSEHLHAALTALALHGQD